jgi:hypothetical protein
MTSELLSLVYELLDAHDDTARLVDGDDLDLRWLAHLEYLRDLQRVGRELMARATRTPAGAEARPAPSH